jgi:flagellar motor switch protein FliM
VSQILSQDEVDALLKGVADGSVETGAASGRKTGVQAFDLTGQERSVRGQWPGLEGILERFVGRVRTSLGSFLGAIPKVSVSGVEIARLGRVMGGLPQPVSLQLFRMPPLRGQGLLVVRPELAAMIFEVFLGGNARRATALAAREFTVIEQRVLGKLASRILQDLHEAWRPLSPVDFALVRAEQNPLFARIAPAEDGILIADLQVQAEGSAEAQFSVCIPRAALDPILERLQSHPRDDADTTLPAWRDRMFELLGDVELEIAVELGARRMRLSEVLALRAGDLLQLSTGRDGPVVVRVEGCRRFVGAPGVVGGSNAVRIKERI